MQTKNKQLGMKQTNNRKRMSSQMETGEIFPLKINALGPKNMGFVSLNNGLTMLIPNANLGDFVKVKIEKILSNSNKKNKNQTKYAIGSVVQVLKKANKSSTIPEMVEVGNVLDLTIKRKGPKNAGLVEF